MNLNRVEKVEDRVALRTCLISTADKHGLEDLVRGLWDRCPDLLILSTGGTYRSIAAIAADMSRDEQLQQISSYTGQPEMQGGLVKTLDYRIYLGLLSESFNADHQADLQRSGARPIDLVVCNFYPFEAAAAGPGASVEDLRTHIDIGGPTMLRAAAKNFLRVACMHDPAAYPGLLAELDEQDGSTSLAWRAAQAAAAFRYTAHYEAAIAGALGSHIRSADLSAVYAAEHEEHDS